MPSPAQPASHWPPDPQALRRASEGIKRRVRELAGGTRQQIVRMAPTALVVALLAAALAPFAVPPSVTVAGFLTVLLNQLGQTGANYVSDALRDVIDHLRAEGVTSPSELAVRDALAEELERRLGGADADGLRREMAALLRSLHGVEAALGAAFDEDAPLLQQRLARALAEFGDLADVVVGALDLLQRGVAEVLSGQRKSAELEERMLLEIGLLRRQVRALAARGARDEERTPRLEPAGGDETPPYRGLAAFQVDDAEWFHGREQMTVTLVNRLAERLAGPSLVMVVGASGAGKSSLLNAGLVPAVRDGVLGVPGSSTWPYLPMTPGATPLRDLAVSAATLAAIPAGSVEAQLRADPTHFAQVVRRTLHAWPRPASGGATGRLLLVVDQFEELFTQCRNPDERRDFVRALCAAAAGRADGEPPAAMVVLGLRADFYTECTAYPELVALLEDSQVVVGPMSRDELRHAIERPAEIAGLALEPGLVDVVLHDLDARLAADDRPAYDAGRLPLLSHALLATWEGRRNRMLSLAAYHAAGGIEQAVTLTADRLYEELGPAERVMVQQLLQRLVVVSRSAAEDARARVSRTELLRERSPADRQAIQTALDALVKARLVTATQDSFEITHEALLRAWGRLRTWIEQNRDRLTVLRQLGEAAEAWERGEGELYGETRLARVREHVYGARRVELDHREQRFLAASEEHVAELRRREQRERRRARMFRVLSAGLAVLVAFSAVLAYLVYQTISKSNELSRTAVSRQIAADSDTLRATDPELSSLLAVQAYRVAPTTQARSSVLSTQDPAYTALRARIPGPLNGIAVSRDGRMLASAGQQGAIELWDPTARRWTATLRDPNDANPVLSVAIAPDGATVAGARLDGTLEVWDVGRETPAAAVHTDSRHLNAVAYSPAGGLLATGGDDGVVQLWNATTYQTVGQLVPGGGPAAPVFGVAFSPDGRTVASAGGDGVVTLWDVASRRGVTLSGHTEPVRGVAFKPDGQLVATGSDDGSVRLWNAASGEPVADLSTGIDPIRTVAFSRDGATLAAGSDLGAVRLWSVASPGTPASLTGSTASVSGLAFGADDMLVGAEEDGTIGLWASEGLPISPVIAGPGAAGSLAVALQGPGILASAGADGTITLRSAGRPVAAPSARFGASPPLALSPDGGTLAVARANGDITLWNTATGSQSGTLPGDGGVAEAIAFSPDGRLLASAGTQSSVKLWDLKTQQVRAPINDHTGSVSSLAFRPDGRTLASAGADGTILLSSVPSGHFIRVITGRLPAVHSVSFSPDGATLASAGPDDQVRLWDVATGRQEASLVGHTASVRSVAFSLDGKTLASAGDDRTIRLWQVSDSALIATLQDAAVGAVTFTFDGHTLAGAGGRGVLFWETDPDRVVSRICRDHPALTKEEWQQYLPSGQPYELVCP